jgi:hypothetical protein
MESKNSPEQLRKDLISRWDQRKVNDLPLTPAEVDIWLANLQACLLAPPPKSHS